MQDTPAPVLIGLSGKMTSGKDTTFGIIHSWAEDLGFVARRRAFADLVKLSLIRLFLPDASVSEAVGYADKIKFDGALILEHERADEDSGQITTLREEISVRLALQRQGTEAHRNVFSYDFWVDALLPLPETGREWEGNFLDPWDVGTPEIAVITDVRFPNEAERIRALGGQVWLIDRVLDRGGPSDAHSSEAGLSADFIDMVIGNHGTLEDLRDLVFSAMEHVRAEKLSA